MRNKGLSKTFSRKPVSMSILAYFATVGTILMGMIMLAENAIGPPPPLWFSTSFQGLPPQRWIPPPEIRTARDVPPSPSEALAFAPITKQAALPTKHKTKQKKMEIARPGAKGADSNYYMRLAQENRGKSW
jgi:hypothetical protein